MIQKIILIIVLFCSVHVIFAFEVPVAEFQSIADTDSIKAVGSQAFSQAVFAAVSALDRQGLVGFKYKGRDVTNNIVRSQMDAVKECEIHGWELLVYGQIVTKEFGYDVEIKIYSHTDRKILRSILLRSTIEDYESLIKDCASKIYTYFSNFLRVDVDKKPFIAESDTIITSHTVEWWGTVPPWLDTTSSIAGYHGTVGIRLGSPIWTNGEWTWIQEFGVGLGFHFGMSKVGVITSYLYDIDFGLNATWAFVWQHQQEIRIGLEPGVKIHILNYQPLFDNSTTDVWCWYGTQLNLEYRFWLDAPRTFGIGLEVGVASYFVDPFYLDYRVGISFAWKGKVE